jgi:two-component system chemotaxis response regulator CheB
MPTIDTIVVGCSAGGVEALRKLIQLLPASLPASICVVHHFPQASTSRLPAILAKMGWPAEHALNGEETRHGRIYVAAPGMHLLLGKSALRVVRGPKENGNRPAIDPLFRSAGRSRGARVVSVLLSGLLDDGTLGSHVVRCCGGTTISQDPTEALFGDMPQNAVLSGAIDHVAPVAGIAERIKELAGRPVDDPTECSVEADAVEMNLMALADFELEGRPSQFVCPECQGTLYEFIDAGRLLYRCRVGHAYSPNSLRAAKEEEMQNVLWSAVRALEEHQDLLGRMFENALQRGYTHAAQGYKAKIDNGSKVLQDLRHSMDELGAALDLEGDRPESPDGLE